MLAHFCACAPLAEPPECPSFPHSAPPSVPCLRGTRHTPRANPLQGLDFEKTGGLMGGALQRLDGLLKAGRQGHMCYLIGFALTVFLLLWWVMSKR